MKKGDWFLLVFYFHTFSVLLFFLVIRDFFFCACFHDLSPFTHLFASSYKSVWIFEQQNILHFRFIYAVGETEEVSVGM